MFSRGSNGNSGTTEITNCTISLNEVTGGGGGIYNQDFASPTIKNCIVWGNISPNFPEQILNSNGNSGSNVRYSCIQGGHLGPGNINEDPLYFDPANGVWYLAPGSPCVDAGENSALPGDFSDLDRDGDVDEQTPVDLFGSARFIDIPSIPDLGVGSPSPIVDMGAYEVTGQPTIIAGDSTFSELDGTVEILVNLGWPGTDPVQVDYAISDGTAKNPSDFSASPGSLGWLPGEDGIRSIPISVVDDMETEPDEAFTLTLSDPTNHAVLFRPEITLTIQSSDIIYVNASADGSNDGTTWTNAFISLSKALESGDPNDEIWVAAGTYTPGTERTSTFQVFDGVTVYGGFKGDEVLRDERDWRSNQTILSGDLNSDDDAISGGNAENAYRVVTTGKDFVLDGFTVEAGNANGPDYQLTFGSGILSLNPPGRISKGRVSNCVIRNNYAKSQGGGMLCNLSEIAIENCEFLDNSAGNSGGAMANSPRDKVTVSDCSFIGNKAGFGGAMRNTGSGHIIVLRSFFSGNSAEFGGAISNSSAMTNTVNNSVFENNSASSRGGGIHNNRSTVMVHSSKFLHNKADFEFGGGLFNDLSTVTMANSVMSENSGDKGGGIFNEESELSVVNCTISANVATGRGAGIYSIASPSVTVRNSIIWENIAGNSHGEIFDPDNVLNTDVQYSCIKGGYPGTGNINSNPFFLRPGEENFYLLPNSPCIDAGNNAVVAKDETDLDQDGNIEELTPFDILGHDRFVDIPEVSGIGAGSPPLVDMGAYEATGGAVIIPADATAKELDGIGHIPVQLHWPANTPVTIDYRVTGGTAEVGSDFFLEAGSLTWAAGSEETQSIPVSIAADMEPEPDETVIVTLTSVSQNAFVLTPTITLTITSPGIIYVDTDANSANDGTTWINAFTDLKEALQSASSDDEIWVAEGTYVPGSTRDATFQLRDNVHIYGGFAGRERLRNEREPGKNVTVLSGDLMNNDGPNFANRNDNAYHVITGADTTLDGFTITGGHSDESTPPHSSGGGILNRADSFAVVNCSIENNSANNGGGIFTESGIMTLDKCVIKNNSAVESGGGLFVRSTDYMRISVCAFSGNSAELGGGVYSHSGVVSVRDSTFEFNQSERGGGLYGRDTRITVFDSAFNDNGSSSGAGVYNLRNITFNAIRCSFTNNSAEAGGGGFYNSQSTVSLNLVNCSISDNSARSGGGIYNPGAVQLAMINCLLVRNSASLDGGGMYNVETGDNKIVMTNCSVQGNSADRIGGGMYNRMASSPIIKNCIFWNNDAGGFDEIYAHPSSSTDVRYSCIQGGFPGIGNINQDPLFVDMPSGNLYLSPESPCIDAGDNTAVPDDVLDVDGDGIVIEAISVDFLGNGRFVDIPAALDSGAGFSSLVDMGAYEVTGNPIIFASDTSAFEADRVGKIPVTLYWADDNTTAINYMTADGTAEADFDYIESSGTIEWAAGTDGTQMVPITLREDEEREPSETVTITFSGPTNQASFSDDSATLTIFSPDIHHVKRDATGSNNGNSWTDAFTDLQDAIHIASEFDEIWVASGTYSPGSTRMSTFQLQDNIELYGGFAGNETKREQRDWNINITNLSGDLNSDDGNNFINNEENSYHVVTGANGTLDGFVISGGNADGVLFLQSDGGGMLNFGVSPVVTNCTFIGNFAHNRGGGMSNSHGAPSVTGCKFTHNRALRAGGGLSNWGAKTRISTSSFTQNVSEDGGGLYTFISDIRLINCTFLGNSADDGGGLYNRSVTRSEIINCAIFNNSADDGGGIYNWSVGGWVLISNCTIANNTGARGGGGIHNEVSSFPKIRNSIIWGNDSGNSENEFHTPMGVRFADVQYSCIRGGFRGVGNIDQDPLFLDQSGGVLMLGEGSPCIDAGDNSKVLADVRDLDGNADTSEQMPLDLFGNSRFFDIISVPDTGVGGAPLVDMGAYETTGQPIVVASDVSARESAGVARVPVEVFWPNGTPIIIEYTISDGTASSGLDYTAVDGSLEWAAGESRTKEIPISIIRDSIPEMNERIDVTFSDDTNAAIIFRSPASLTILSEDTIHVDQEASGNGDGSSWANAFTDLQAALGAADASDQVWVTAGVYTPGASRMSTFKLIPGVDLYGGFAGSELSREQRDWTINKTILSGDLDKNDGSDNRFNEENSYHVVTGANDAVLDGFTVTGGNANGEIYPQSYGGGVLNFGTSPILLNCTIVGNSAKSNGGGMYCHSSTNGVTVENCRFSRNSARSGGGLAYTGSFVSMIDSSVTSNSADFAGGMRNSDANLTMVNCLVLKNSSSSHGGGISNSLTTATLTNCVIARNTTNGTGGGMNNSSSSPHLVNCTLFGNFAQRGGGAIHNWNFASAMLRNCISWNNTTSGGISEEISFNSDSTAEVQYSCIKGGYLGIGNIDADPLFVNLDGPDDIIGTDDDNFRLQPGSPAIDAGNNEIDIDPDTDGPQQIFDIDLGGNPRLIDDPQTADTGAGKAPIIDMGAYEFLPVPDLIGHWKMDEETWTGSKGEVIDSSGLGHHGTSRNGAQVLMKGKINGAGEFDGVDDYIAIENLHFDVPGVLETLTVCGWVKTTVGGNQGFANWSIVDFDRSEYFAFYVRGDDGRIGFSTTDSAGMLNDFSGSTSVNDGAWHFVCAVYDGTDKILYVDGVEDGRLSNAHRGKGLGTGLDRYGFIGDGSEASEFDGSRNELYYEGALDEIKMYNRALAADEIQTTFDEGSLLFHYPFEGDAIDSTGRNNGVVHGATLAPGISGQGFAFDGIGNYIAIENLHFDTPGVLETLTVCGWVKTAVGGDAWFGNWSIVDFDRSEYFAFYVRGDDGRIGFSTTDSAGMLNDFSGSTRVNDGAWHFVCAVYDGTDKILYVDGVEDNRGVDVHSGKGLGTGLVRYGFLGDGSEAEKFDSDRNELYYQGALDEIRLYAQAFSLDEIRSLYEAPALGAGIIPVAPIFPDTSGVSSELPSSLAAVLSRTVYEDAEDGTVDGWSRYGEGEVVNLEDASGNRIISTEAQLFADPFRLGLDDESDWNNSEEFTTYFAIMMEQEAAVYFRVDTTDGEKYLCYRPGPDTVEISDTVICFGLGIEPNGQWHVITRNLATDLERALSNVVLVSIKDFYVFGRVKLDDLMLLKNSTD